MLWLYVSVYNESNEVIYIIIADTKCSSYKQKQNMVVDEGNPLPTQMVFGHTVEECKTKCTDMDGCLNFRYCPIDRKCFFKDKKISESSPEKTQTACFTVYQDCEDGIHGNKITSIFISNK